ncbi:MAG TPA: alpha-isopropylmalate synthase regulatory domain-containing protein, partial [Paludibacteraceae bacterium]|nr:alpha-isopropylmalate synthase regulatory domain-containing protein [Paludibacteraceae bacterium]
STNINEPELNRVSKLVEAYSGIRIPPNKPVVGDNVFTQCAGIHADGDAKKNLYFNDLLPERFGRIREYALGKTSGKANIRKNLEALGIELDEESMHKVTQRIIELGDQKQVVTQDDLPYIVSDIVKEENIAENVRILNYSLSLAQGLKPIANILIEINGETYQEYATGDGQYDAFMKALWKIYDTLGKPHPILLDYLVTIPPGGRTDALVQTLITWDLDGNVFKTHGLDGDQTAAAIKATLKMLNRI